MQILRTFHTKLRRRKHKRHMNTEAPKGLPADPGSYAKDLDELARMARRDLRYLGEETPNWVPAKIGTDVDVLIIGGGQSGMAASFLLRRTGIRRIRVVDAAPQGREGVWLTTARMQTLRSSKTLPGPELGIAPLSFRAWYETVRGVAAYDALERCARTDWAAYLSWYRTATDTQVENDTKVVEIIPTDAGFSVQMRRGDSVEIVVARKIVLATGMGGAGKPFIPQAIRNVVDPARYSHTDQPIDFAALHGKRIGVLGAASSALDAAAQALEQGAARADLFCRHPDLVRVTTIKGMAYAGVMDHYHELADDRKWDLMHHYFSRSAGPIANTVQRACAQKGFHLHFGQTWDSVRQDGETVIVEAGSTQYEFDHVIAGTGYVQDITARPELSAISGEIALWRDRYTPPAGLASDGLSSYPYLDAGLAFTERTPGTLPQLSDIYCLNYGATMSHGRAVGEITSLRHGTPRMVHAIGRDLFMADWEAQRNRLRSYDTPDLTGREYRGELE